MNRCAGAELAVVIVTHNSAKVIGDLLDSLPDALAGVPAQTVVVDNGSTDGTAELLDERTGIQVIRSANVGYSAGINKGVAACSNESDILVLNPDAVLEPVSVATMLETARTPGVGIVVPKIIGADGTLARSLKRRPTIPRFIGLGFTGLAFFNESVTDADSYDRQHEVDWATGAVMLIRRPCYDHLNGWDESYFLYSEETDFCLRAKDKGWSTVYEPAAQSMHIEGGSGRSERTEAMLIVNQVRLYARRHGRIASWLFFLATALTEVSRVARGRPNSRSALAALLWPSKRPTELGLGSTFIPRDNVT